MENMKQDQIVDAEYKEVDEKKEPAVTAEFTVKLLSNGELRVDMPKDGQLDASQVEQITQSLHTQLRDQRIAQMALEMFKSKLSF